MGARLRLFVAVVPEPAALDELERAIERARTLPGAQSLRFASRERLHLTLRFLGAVPEPEVDALRRACAEVAASNLAFPLTLAGAGAFSSVARASVVWIGASDGADSLCALAEAVSARIDSLGYAREPRAFTPHLTVARSKRPSAQRATVEALSRGSIQTPVRELVLMRSHLGANARYEALEHFGLQVAGAEA